MQIKGARFRSPLGRILGTVLAIWLWLLTPPARTANAQDECFCIAHSLGAILRGCTAYKARTDFYATAVCTDPDTGKKAEQTITTEWRRLTDGEDLCTPCRRQVRGTTDETPRAKNGESGTPSPQTSKPGNQESAK